MPDAPSTAAEYWDAYKPGAGQAPRTDRFEWTQYPGHGPGVEVLGSPRKALELGPAEGCEAAHLARRGVVVTGVDLSRVQVERARAWWRETPGLCFLQGEACAFLASDTAEYDAIYSVWGAVWFADPEALFPRVRERLRPAGVFAFSHAEPEPGAYGPQPMRGRWLDGRRHELTVIRWQYTAETWADLLKRHGFTRIDARVLAAPKAQGEGPGTLLVRARTPSVAGD